MTQIYDAIRLRNPPDSDRFIFPFQTSVTVEIRYQTLDGTVGVWSDMEFLEVPDDHEGTFQFETDSLLSGHSQGSGVTGGRSPYGIPTFRKYVTQSYSDTGNVAHHHAAMIAFHCQYCFSE